MPFALLIQLLPVLVSSIGELYDLISKIHAALSQNAELTSAQEATRDAHFKDLESQPWWKPDA